MKDKLFSLQSAIVKYCENVQRKNPFLKNALHDLQGAISQEAGKTQAYENTFALMVLPKLLEKKTGKQDYELIKLLSEDHDFDEEVGPAKFPTIIGVTESVVKIDRLALAIEGQTLLDGSSFPLESVLFAMHQCYNVFNIPKRIPKPFWFYRQCSTWAWMLINGE
ncbi:Hypothetical predicted protein [Paramuricea clavata]|uniref:Uncharacterized protein n=1 Tax=Paramuricea clavata TaxID=317549 RepID=A0A7D9IP65_PARCT|nr:Hypothetical predicted protein [Paramuricea clavata]